MLKPNETCSIRHVQQDCNNNFNNCRRKLATNQLMKSTF